ncbi:hypothetical protein RCO48_26475 [Peribacillus frigoritolerans]|nr:hypothetical protein [Peribacillus frigoritolerans]
MPVLMHLFSASLGFGRTPEWNNRLPSPSIIGMMDRVISSTCGEASASRSNQRPNVQTIKKNCRQTPFSTSMSTV